MNPAPEKTKRIFMKTSGSMLQSLNSLGTSIGNISIDQGLVVSESKKPRRQLSSDRESSSQKENVMSQGGNSRNVKDTIMRLSVEITQYKQKCQKYKQQNKKHQALESYYLAELQRLRKRELALFKHVAELTDSTARDTYDKDETSGCQNQTCVRLRHENRRMKKELSMMTALHTQMCSGQQEQNSQAEFQTQQQDYGLRLQQRIIQGVNEDGKPSEWMHKSINISLR